MATFTPTSSKVGVDLNNPTTASNFGLGDMTFGLNGSEWTYIQANGAISAGALVQINTGGTGTPATAAGAAAGAKLAFAQAAFTDTQFGWVCVRGNPITVLVSATSTLNVVLYVGTTSGSLSTTASSGTLAGVALLTASTTAVLTAFQAVVSWPRCVSAE